MGVAFEELKTCPRTQARIGRLSTPHGDVTTPVFMPVGTHGSVKGIRPEGLVEVGARLILANAFHLACRPGHEVVRKLGGLHRFMGWNGPILTDSGGFQVFSLAHRTRVDEDGATVRSVVDGAPIRLTPESVMEIESALGADVIMALDHCATDPEDREEVAQATERTHRWLERCARAWRDTGGEEGGQALFGIVQGGAFDDLRRASAEAVTAHELPGYAIGGVSVGENRELVRHTVQTTTPLLPRDRPRYLMGVGTPLDFFEAVTAGIDMFDCVTPTRHGRNHQAYTSRGRVNLRNARFAEDDGPLDPECGCSTCRGFTRGYLRHLCVSGEMLAGILLTLHNLSFFFTLLDAMRAAIAADGLPELRARVEGYQRRL